ncbi:unnamed protein product, partial [Candidula unifasciata]
MFESITPLRMWIAVSVGLGAVAIALMAVVIRLKISESNCEAGNAFWRSQPFFRTKEEQAEVEKQFPALNVNNACCVSSTKQEMIHSALTINNINVTVLQNINSSQFQYFPIETCR